MLESFRARVSLRLLPVEPFHQRWNVFRLFDLEHDETRWTQWFAAILREENGARCARVAWRAVCEAIAKRALRQPPIGDVADASHWRAVASETPCVEDEVAAGELGRLDILVVCDSLVAAIENKLWAHWHDGAGEAQAERYRKIALQRRGPMRRSAWA